MLKIQKRIITSISGTRVEIREYFRSAVAAHTIKNMEMASIELQLSQKDTVISVFAFVSAKSCLVTEDAPIFNLREFRVYREPVIKTT